MLSRNFRQREPGADAVDALPKGIRNNKEAASETIKNNVRKLIIEEQPINPKYYEKMSELLDALIQQQKGCLGLPKVSGRDRRADEEGEKPGPRRVVSERTQYPSQAGAL